MRSCVVGVLVSQDPVQIERKVGQRFYSQLDESMECTSQ